MSKVHYRVAERLGPEKMSAEKYSEGAWVEITMDSEMKFQRSIGYAIGSKQRPFDSQMHLAKFQALTNTSLCPKSQMNLADEVSRLEELSDIKVLAGYLRIISDPGRLVC